MRIASLLAWRSLASRPGRSLTAALGIAIGIATVLSVQVIDHNTILTQEARNRSSVGPWEVALRPVQSGVPLGGATPRALVEESDISEFIATFEARVEIERPDLDPTALRLRGLGPLADNSLAETLIEGRSLRQPNGLEVLISARAAEQCGIALGDRLPLRRMGKTRRGCVEGQQVMRQQDGPEGAMLEFEVVGILASAGPSDEVALVAPFEAALPLFEGAPLQATYWAQLNSGAVYQDVRERLKSAYIVEKVKTARVGQRIDQRAFRKSLRFTSALSLVLGLFVIYHCFSMALVERVREIGLLRALGMRRMQILRATLLEGSYLAVFGAGLGIALTVATVFVMDYFGITTLGYGKPLRILEVPWGMGLGVVALGMLCALLGMAAPLLRARHLSVVEALRAGQLALRTDPGFSLRLAVFIGIPLMVPLFYVLVTPPLGERQGAVFDVVLRIGLVLLAFFMMVLVFPRPLHKLVEWGLQPLRRWLPVEVPLAQAAIRGSRLRVMGTLAGLAVVVAALFCIRSVNVSFLEEMERFSVRAMDDRVFLRSRSDVALTDIQERLAAVDGVEATRSLGAEVLSPFPLRGVDLEGLRAAEPRLGENLRFCREFSEGKVIVLSRFLADSFGYEVGDEVRLPTFTGPRSFRVGAITDRFGYYPDDRNWAMVDADRMDQLWCQTPDEGRRFVATIDPDADREEVEGNIEEALSDLPILWVRCDDRLRRTYLLDRRRDFFVFDVILFMVAALAAVGLWNSLTIAVLERRRELALLRTVGLSARQVGRLVRLEALALGLIGGLLALAVSLPVAAFAIEAVRIISRLDLHFRPGPLLIAAPLVVAMSIALLASWWPSRRARSIDLSAMARYE